MGNELEKSKGILIQGGKLGLLHGTFLAKIG